MVLVPRVSLACFVLDTYTYTDCNTVPADHVQSVVEVLLEWHG